MLRLFLPLMLVFACVAPVFAQSATQELTQGKVAYDHDDYRGAESHFDRALRASNGNPALEQSALHGRGTSRLELHKWSAAKDDLTRAVELDPTDAGAFAARGMARKGLGDYDGLLLDAHEAARLSPTGFSSFEDDAKSTVLFRRMMLVFLILAGILLMIGGLALGRVLVRVMRAESQANRAAR